MPKLPSIMESMSLKDIDQIAEILPEYKSLVSRQFSDNYDEFSSVINSDLDRIVAQFQENPELMARSSEDEITIRIKQNLCLLGYDADHECKVGGHADLVVRKRSKDWIWIGEAKKHSDYSWLLKGFNQLTTRYAPGVNGSSQGALLIYIACKDARNVMDTWLTRLKAANDEPLNHTPCLTNSLSFYSEHKHKSSGLPFKVRHLPFVLHFEPEDT